MRYLMMILCLSGACVAWAVPVSLENVLDSVTENHPALVGAWASRDEKVAKQEAALGAFDAKFKSDSKTYAAGYYEGRYVDSYIAKPLRYQGVEVYSGFRVSDGDFPTYDGDLATAEDGEFRVGARIPLVRNRDIDEPRGTYALETMEIEAADWKVFSTRLKLAAAGSQAYWKWVATGLKVGVIKNLVEVARLRNAQLEVQVQAGDKPRFDLVDNQRSVLKRESELIKVENELANASLKLSFYFRDSQGEPVVLPAQQSPGVMPDPDLAEFYHLDEKKLLAEAYAQRPELRILQVRKAQISTETDMAENLFLPQIDFDVMAAQDFGPGKASLEPGEVKAGFKIEVPLQYRKARGKLRAAQAAARSVAAEGTVVKDQIAIAVRREIQSVRAALERVKLATAELKASRELERGEVIRFNQGDSNLIFVNYREQTAAEAAIKQIESLLEYQYLAANLRASLGRVWKGFSVTK
jgi:cobalt-zinc-cadmium efflux system outer membrane protein